MNQEQKERLFSVFKVMGVIIGIAEVWTAFGFLWSVVIPKIDGYSGIVLVMAAFITPLGLALLTGIILGICKLYFWLVCGHTEYYEYKYYIMKNKQAKPPKKNMILDTETDDIQQYMPEVEAAINKDPYEELKQKESI